MSKLGHRIEATSTIDELLPAILRSTVEALSLPYAALFLDSPSGPHLAAAAGTPTTLALNLPLTHSGRQIGTLVIGERDPGYTFSQKDRALLQDLARQIGVAAASVSLTNDLQQSRERIVIAREEERRRLRRDLHDGLGAHLAALLIQTSTLRAAVHRDPAEADAEIDRLRTELRTAVQDIRRLVTGLRPPALDELGLIGALTERLQQFDSGGIEAGESSIRVSFTAPNNLPPLGAALEVAIYRITDEAMTNIVKHSHATTATASISVVGKSIELAIRDNGAGFSASFGDGIGLDSMRERASELGGTLSVDQNASEPGTTVLATFPLPGPSQ